MNHISPCPHCHADLGASPHITERAQVCPHCQHPLGGAVMDFKSQDLDTNVRRGNSLLTLVFGTLLAANVVGIYWVYSHYHGIDLVVLLCILFAPLDLLVIFLIPHLICRRWMSQRDAVPIPWSVHAGFIVGAILSAVLFFFFTCHGLMALKGVGL